MARLVLARLAAWRGRDFAAMRAAWLEHAPPLGTPMVLHQGARRIEGDFAGLDDDGHLRLGTGDDVCSFAAGEVSLQPGG